MFHAPILKGCEARANLQEPKPNGAPLALTPSQPLLLTPSLPSPLRRPPPAPPSCCWRAAGCYGGVGGLRKVGPGSLCGLREGLKGGLRGEAPAQPHSPQSTALLSALPVVSGREGSLALPGWGRDRARCRVGAHPSVSSARLGQPACCPFPVRLTGSRFMIQGRQRVGAREYGIAECAAACRVREGGREAREHALTCVY